MSQTKALHSVMFGQVSVPGIPVNVALLLLRIYAGYTIMMAGLDKLPLPDWMTEQVAAIGFPAPGVFAWIASFGEFAFGFLLCIGLMTRLSGTMLAIIMGVASFGSQKLIPLLDMHIAQHFFWIFVVFALLGAGKYSLDRLIYLPRASSPTRLSFVVIPVLLALLTVGLYRESSPQPAVTEEVVEITSVSVAGSFNDWNPAANKMQSLDGANYTLQVDFEEAGQIEFKFTANKTWDINWGEEDQPFVGFPISGRAEGGSKRSVRNIGAYIPRAGLYRIDFNSETYVYSLDTVAVH